MTKYSHTSSAAWLERAKKVLASWVSSEFRKYNHPHALFYTHGKGNKIYDVDGNEYLDFTLSQGPLILGHSHPKVLEAVHQESLQGQLYAGQHAKETGHKMLVSGIGPVVHTVFTSLEKVEDFPDVLRFDKGKLKSFISAMHDKGLRVIGRGLWYISAEHTEAEIDQALELAREVLTQQDK